MSKDSQEDIVENANIQTTEHISPGSIPAVVAFAYHKFVTSGQKWSATCKQCNRPLSERRGVTSAFTK